MNDKTFLYFSSCYRALCSKISFTAKALKTPSQIPDQDPDQETFSHVTQLRHSTAVILPLKTAAELGVFDIMAKAGPGAKLSPAEIVAQLPNNNPKAPGGYAGPPPQAPR